MNCIHCGKNFENPLELYSGELKCPFCGRDVLPAFSVTPENEELFGLSEQFFHTYLTEASAGAEARGYAYRAWKKRTDRLLKQAIEYCRRAAYTGHPEAVVRLGFYYDNNYIDYGRTDSDRDVIAYKYYASVLFDEAQGTVGTRGSSSVTARLLSAWKEKGPEVAERVRRIRRRAAIYLLTMLSSASEELARRDTYDLQTHISLLVRANVVREGEFAVRRTELPKVNRVDEVFKLLLSFGRPSDRSPFFGYYVLSGAELRRLAERLGGMSSRERSACKLLVQGAPLVRKGEDVFLNTSEIYTLARRTGKIPERARVPATVPASGSFCVFFFNENCEGAYVRRAMIEEFINRYDGLKSRGYSLLLNEDVHSHREETGVTQVIEHVFYADDLYYVKKFKDEAHLLRKLVD